MQPHSRFPGPPAAAPERGPRSSNRHSRDLCVLLLSAALILQSLFVMHVLSEAQPDGDRASRPVLAAGFSGRLGISRLEKWYCAKVAKRGGGDAESGRALAPSGPPSEGQCAAAVSAALETVPSCLPCTKIVMSCRPHPTPGKTCPTCASASKCPALPDPHAAAHSALPAAAASPSPHDHTKASVEEEMDEFGEALRARFTDMTCHLYPDETELCVYANALCYDGSHVLLSVPFPPGKSKGDPYGMGYVLGDPTGGCYDYRYYEPSALEFNACKFDLFKFNRVSRYTPVQGASASATPRPTAGTSHTGTPSRSRSPTRSPLHHGSNSSAAAALAVADDFDVPVRRPNVDWALPLQRRRWGPFNRGAVKFREVPDTVIFGPRPKAATVLRDGAILLGDKHTALTEWRKLRSAPPPGRYHAGFHPDTDPTLAHLRRLGLGVDSVTKAGGTNTTVYWLDGPLWATAMDAQFDRHIYHATTRLMGLYHAQRHNTSRWGDSPGDGYLPPLTDAPLSRGYDSLPPLAANHPLEDKFKLLDRLALAPGDAEAFDDEVAARWRGEHGNSVAGSGRAKIVRPNRVAYHSNAGWNVPAQDYVVLTGNNQAPPSGMIPFLRNVAALVAQPHTRFVAGPSLAGVLHPNTTLLCARSGAVTGTHPRLFMNRADAWMFRRYAYDFAGTPGAGLNPHMHHPPRKITLLTRGAAKGRNFENEAALLAAIRATGVPFEVIRDMGDYTFKQQVLKMAGTGVLIAAHGAALVNAMFLPQHAVVVELFPYMLKKATYFNLAGLLGLWYLPLFCPMPTLTGREAEGHLGVQMVKQKALNGQDFLEGCVAANMSSVDALLHHRCNSVAKHLPLKVDIPAFSATLREALDIIAAFSKERQEWAGELAQLQGSRAPVAVPSKAAAGAAAPGSSKPATGTKQPTTKSATASTHGSSSKHASATKAAAGGGASKSATASRSRTPTASSSKQQAPVDDAAPETGPEAPLQDEPAHREEVVEPERVAGDDAAVAMDQDGSAAAGSSDADEGRSMEETGGQAVGETDGDAVR